MIIKKIAFLAVSASLFIFFPSCDGGQMSNSKKTYDSLKNVPAETWKKLGEKKIYFGHQSVGFNIISGIEDLMKDYPEIDLKIVETKGPEDFKTGIFGHSRIGENRNPELKMTDFQNVLDKGVGKRVDIAALKFCYVDMTGDTDVESLFKKYVEMVDRLKAKFPDMRIVHFTAPLKTNETNWKTWLKKLFGKKDLWEYRDNIKRNQYNQLLRAKYQGKEPVMDIAGIESTYPDGKRSSFTVDGKTLYSMVSEYTYDGGHLNESGRRRVAEKLLILLANLT